MTPADTTVLRTAIFTLSHLLGDADDSATVEIPVAEYQRLLAYERLGKRGPTLPTLSCPRSRIDRDEEVAFFIAERAGRMLLKEIKADCERHFGRDRTPGLSTIHRFIRRLMASQTPIRSADAPISV